MKIAYNVLQPRPAMCKLQKLQSWVLRIISYHNHSSLRARRQLLCIIYKHSKQLEAYPQLLSMSNTRSADKIEFSISKAT